MARLRDGRLVVLLALVLYAVVLQYPRVTMYAPQWPRLGVVVTTTSFADLRSVTSAWDCARRGVPVLEHNLCDPFGRPANYPQLWVRLSFLGLGQDDSTKLGVIIGLVFFASVFLVMGRLTIPEGLVWSALLVSPTVMFGVERGNVDIVLFAVIAVALVSVAARRRIAGAAGCGLIELAAMLKLFPICAAGALLHWRRRYAAIAFSLIVVVFAAYAVVLRHELETIRRIVPRPIQQAYGAGVLVGGLRAAFGTRSFLVSDRIGAIEALVAVTLLVSVGLRYLILRRRREMPEASTRLYLYWGGAGIFVGTWALTEYSYDYRLAFTLLAVPQLLEWARQPRPAMPFPRVALLALVAVLWLSAPGAIEISKVVLNHPWLAAETHFPFDDLLVWPLAVYFMTGLLLTLPSWLEDTVRTLGNDLRRRLHSRTLEEVAHQASAGGSATERDTAAT